MNKQGVTGNRVAWEVHGIWIDDQEEHTSSPTEEASSQGQQIIWIDDEEKQTSSPKEEEAASQGQ